MIQRLQKINKWRAQYNPLRSLTFQRAVSLLEEGERGAYADLQWTYRSIEKRDATLRGLVQLRTGAIKKLDWDIKIVDRADPALGQAQEKVLRAAYERISNLRQAIAFLALAEFRGFAHLEKRYQGDNPAEGVIRLEPVEQWHWVRETSYGAWQYNADAGSGATRGIPIQPEHFIVREVAAPINEIGLICYLRKNLSQKDWDGFVETYGIPPLFIELPPNTPPEKEAEYQEMAEAVIGDLRGTLPSGAKVQTGGDSARGINPFRDHLTYQDEQLVLAGTSGKLTMLTAPTGLGSGVADGHQDTFDSLAQAEAGEISEAFQRQFDRAVLDANGFAGAPAAAYFELAAVAKEDAGQILDNAAKAKAAGFQADAAEVSEKAGMKLTLAPLAPQPFGGVPGQPPRPAFNRASPVSPDAEALRADARKRVAEALRAKLKPVVAALQAAADSDDDKAMDAALAQARAVVRGEAKRLGLGADDPLVKAFEESLGTAVVEGAAAGALATTANHTTSVLNWLISLFRR